MILDAPFVISNDLTRKTVHDGKVNQEQSGSVIESTGSQYAEVTTIAVSLMNFTLCFLKTPEQIARFLEKQSPYFPKGIVYDPRLNRLVYREPQES